MSNRTVNDLFPCRIVQEIAYARSVTIHVGKFTIEYNALVQFMSYFVETMRVNPEMFSKLCEEDFFWNHLFTFCRLQGPNRILKCGESRTVNLPTAEVLERLRGRQCSDPRDHIFGVLGLTDLAASANTGLSIDYLKPPDQVFQDATRAIIEETGRLDVICSAQRNPVMEGDVSAWKSKLKSWVPDWSETSANETSLVHDTAVVSLRACGQQTRAICRFDSSAALTVTGYLLGQVSGLAGGAVPNNYGVSEGDWDDLTDHGTREVSFTDEELLEAVWTVAMITECINMLYTMCSGKEPQQYYEGFIRTITVEWVDRSPEFLMPTYISFIKQWYRRFWPNPQGDQDQIAPEIVGEKRVIGNSFTVQEYISLRLMSSRMRNRRYFVFWRETCSSTPGQIVVDHVWQGLSPVHTRKGDCVCILPGCNAPIILREVVTAAGKAYEIIGAAYVESLSHGEVDDLSDLKLQEFRLV